MPQPDELSPELVGMLTVTGGIIAHATALRAFTNPPSGSAPDAVHLALVDARARLDQLEELLGQAMDARHASAMEATRLEQAAQDAWDEVADSSRKQGLRAEFEGAQERYATWRLKTRPQHLAARNARAMADIAAACEAKVRMLYRGLDGTRQDLHKRLSALAFENNLERSG